MAKTKRELEQSALAERRLVKLFEVVWHLARHAAEKVLGQGKAAIRRAIERVLRDPSVRSSLRLIAGVIEASLRRQLTKLMGTSLPRKLEALEAFVKQWEQETMSALRALLLGGRRDAVHADAWPSLLELATKASAESVAEAARNLGRSAAQAVQRVKVAARARALNLGGAANRTIQVGLGIKQYRWRTQLDSRVRPMHADLEGTLQSWSSPPVISADGRTGHPGEDYNCRCVAVPVY